MAAARNERRLFPVGCRVEPVVTHPAPPQTRTCATHAYGSSSKATAARARNPCSTVLWPAVVRVGELRVSPLFPASGCSARRRLPSRGSLGPHFPTFAGTMRRYDCPLSLSGASLVARLPDTLPASVCSWCPLRAHGQGGSSQPRQGLWSPGPPLRACGQGDRWLSHVPAFPRWLHAPLSDPGGVLDTRHTASRTAAFRRLHTVGFPLDTS